MKWLNNSNNKPIISVSIDKCNVQLQKCKIDLENININIEISIDENIFYLQRFNVLVLTKNKGNNIEDVYIDFKMKNMNMGLNHFTLMKKSTNNINQMWSGKALLPVCITGRADWFAKVEVVTKEEKYILSFPILVKRARN